MKLYFKILPRLRDDKPLTSKTDGAEPFPVDGVRYSAHSDLNAFRPDLQLNAHDLSCWLSDFGFLHRHRHLV